MNLTKRLPRLYAPTEKKPRWRVTWYEGARRRERAFTQKYNAQAFYDQAKAAQRTGETLVHTPQAGATISTAWKKFVNSKKGFIGEGYSDQLDRFGRNELKPFNHLKIEDLSSHHIQKIVDTKSTPNAKSRVIEKIRPFLIYCYQKGTINTPPRDILAAVQVRSRRQPRRGSAETVRSFDMREVYALVKGIVMLPTADRYQKAFPDKNKFPDFCERTSLMIILQASTGLRIGELKALTIGDITTYPNDAFPSEINVNSQFLEHTNGKKEVALPKNQKTRTVTIPAWTAPIQIDKHGTYRKATHILEKFGAPPQADTWEQLTHARCEWLERRLRPSYPRIKIQWDSEEFFCNPSITRTLHNITVTIDGIRWMPLRTFQARDEIAHPDHTTTWHAFYDDGNILPLREILWAYLEKLGQDWKNHKKSVWPANLQALENPEFSGGLLWPALRPPRSNTKPPTGDAFIGLPWNGNHVPQQVTRVFLRTALEHSGIYEPIRPGHTRRTLREMRHTFAITALRQGTPVPVVAQQLGHSDPSVTLSRYAAHFAWSEAPNFTL